jgi:hypothetical protein
MAQKFLPSHRKWLDYEAVLKTEVSPSIYLHLPQVKRSGRYRSVFFCFYKKNYLIGGRVNAKIFYV